jgi:hypothetical protein
MCAVGIRYIPSSHCRRLESNAFVKNRAPIVEVVKNRHIEAIMMRSIRIDCESTGWAVTPFGGSIASVWRRLSSAGIFTPRSLQLVPP